ncbi:MAG: hypothetical protein HOP18_10280 [Deltaproteobacteria bacterium]|nr:hypothetical protein [Deltaproteobacteria bacterium]
MNLLKTTRHGWPLITLIIVTMLTTALPDGVEAGDVGVARSTGSIAEIGMESAVAGSIVVRSLRAQEGAPGAIQILDIAPAGNIVLNSGPVAAGPDGQYTVPLLKPLVVGQRIQAFNVTKGYYSSTVIVDASQPPFIDERLSKGETQIRGRGTPGSTIQIRNAVTNAVLGTGTVAPAPSTGAFSITLNAPLRLFHTIRPVDVTKGLTGRNVSVLNLLTGHTPLKPSCSVTQTMIGAFTKTTYACGLPNPRGVMLDGEGNPLIVAGTAPLDRGYSLLPSGLFRLAPPRGNPPTAALSLFAPVSGVAIKPGPGGAFGTDVFVARPRFFNARGQSSIQPGDGEIFRIHPTSAAISVSSRALNFSPTGLAFPPLGSPFPNNLFVSDFFGGGLRQIGPSGVIANFGTPLGLQGLLFGPGPASAFGTSLYVTQPSSGSIFRISTTGAHTPFATGMVSPTEMAFGPGVTPFGNNLYVTDAGNGQLLRINSAGVKTVVATGLGAPFGLVFRTTPLALFVTDYLSGNVIQFTPLSR